MWRYSSLVRILSRGTIFLIICLQYSSFIFAARGNPSNMHRAVCTCAYMRARTCMFQSVGILTHRMQVPPQGCPSRKITKQRLCLVTSQGSVKLYSCSVRSHLQASFLTDTSHSVSLEVMATSDMKLNETHHYLEQNNRYAQCTTQQNISQTSLCF